VEDGAHLHAFSMGVVLHGVHAATTEDDPLDALESELEELPDPANELPELLDADALPELDAATVCFEKQSAASSLP